MAIYNREDPRTALPQLEKRLDNIIDVFYPVGSYFESSDPKADPNKLMGGKWELEEGRPIIINGNSVTVTASQYYEVTSITLQPNTKYMVYAGTSSNNGTSFQMGCFFSISGASYVLQNDARVTTGAGQGTSGWAYVVTGDTNATVKLNVYGYYTTSHVEYGRLVAVPLYNRGNNRWHRIA